MFEKKIVGVYVILFFKNLVGKINVSFFTVQQRKYIISNSVLNNDQNVK